MGAFFPKIQSDTVKIAFGSQNNPDRLANSI